MGLMILELSVGGAFCSLALAWFLVSADVGLVIICSMGDTAPDGPVLLCPLREISADTFSMSLSSPSSLLADFLSFFLLLKRPESMPPCFLSDFLSFFFSLLSLLVLSSCGEGVLTRASKLLLLRELSVELLFEAVSSRSRPGVREILRVSMLSSLRKESALRGVPLRDLSGAASVGDD